jgi:hypothetical protein
MLCCPLCVGVGDIGCEGEREREAYEYIGEERCVCEGRWGDGELRRKRGVVHTGRGGEMDGCTS